MDVQPRRAVEALDEVQKNKSVLVFEIANQALSAVRLPGGDTLVGGSRYLHRYDAKGKKISQLDVTSAMQVKHY